MAKKSILDPANASKNDIQRANELLASLSRGAPLSSGRSVLEAYLRGEEISYSQMVKAKCCECSGYYMDGRHDCQVHTCPLYSAMPYGAMRRKRGTDGGEEGTD